MVPFPVVVPFPLVVVPGIRCPVPWEGSVVVDAPSMVVFDGELGTPVELPGTPVLSESVDDPLTPEKVLSPDDELVVVVGPWFPLREVPASLVVVSEIWVPGPLPRDPIDEERLPSWGNGLPG